MNMNHVEHKKLIENLNIFQINYTLNAQTIKFAETVN